MTGRIDRPDDLPDDFHCDGDVDPERLAVCAYWRCGTLFEQRSADHRFCRKACRSRQHKWERARERRARREDANVQGRNSRPSKSPDERQRSM